MATCSSRGNICTIRLMVSIASTVCRVENTRWPVSAASMTVLIVTWSRISPTRMTSGSWRSAERSAPSKPMVSKPISRWFTIPRLSSNMYSTGSSIVTMCAGRLMFTTSSKLARVVDLPEPVMPVTRTRPRCSSASSRTRLGRLRRSKAGICEGMIRMTMPVVPRWRNTLTR